VDMRMFKVRVKGTAPLLHHRFPIEKQTSKTKKATGTAKDYKKEAEESLYRDEKGRIVQPTSHIEGALVKAGTSFMLKGKKTYKDLLKSSVFVEEEFVPLDYEEWVTDARPVTVQRSRVVRHRPRFDKWACEFNLTVVEDDIREDTLKEILEHAGKFVGIGDFRPKFGRFVVEGFEEV